MHVTFYKTFEIHVFELLYLLHGFYDNKNFSMKSDLEMFQMIFKKHQQVFRTNDDASWNIYNGIIFPSLNPAKNFLFNFR